MRNNKTQNLRICSASSYQDRLSLLGIGAADGREIGVRVSLLGDGDGRSEAKGEEGLLDVCVSNAVERRVDKLQRTASVHIPERHDRHLLWYPQRRTKDSSASRCDVWKEARGLWTTANRMEQIPSLLWGPFTPLTSRDTSRRGLGVASRGPETVQETDCRGQVLLGALTCGSRGRSAPPCSSC